MVQANSNHKAKNSPIGQFPIVWALDALIEPHHEVAHTSAYSAN